DFHRSPRHPHLRFALDRHRLSVQIAVTFPFHDWQTPLHRLTRVCRLYAVKRIRAFIVAHSKTHTLEPAAQSLGPVTAEEAALVENLDFPGLPRQVAVTMDATGRWDEPRHLPRVAAHRAGTQTARSTIKPCARLKVEALTLYAFSLENWRRPKTE